MSAYGVEYLDIEKSASLKERTRQAVHPPEVRRVPVKSTALNSLGYQRQTRRLAVEMHSRPGNPYVYRVDPRTARKVVQADSKGRAYTSEIRGKKKRTNSVTPVGRARLFAHPTQVDKGDHPVRTGAKRGAQAGAALGGLNMAGGVMLDAKQGGHASKLVASSWHKGPRGKAQVAGLLGGATAASVLAGAAAGGSVGAAGGATVAAGRRTHRRLVRQS